MRVVLELVGDAGGRVARCCLVIRIGLTLRYHGYAAGLRQAPCKVSGRCGLVMGSTRCSGGYAGILPDHPGTQPSPV